MSIVGLLVLGLIVGALARLFHRGEERMGVLATMGIGVASVLVVGLLGFVVGRLVGFALAVLVGIGLVALLSRR